jgi:hypothetical protein
MLIGIRRAVIALQEEVGYKVMKVTLKWTWRRKKTGKMRNV